MMEIYTKNFNDNASCKATLDGMLYLSDKGINVPKIISFDSLQIKMEMIPYSPSSLETIVDEIIKMHKITNDRYGFWSNNFIGLTKQINEWTTDWPSFFKKCRIEFQYQLLIQNRLIDKELENLFILLDTKIETILKDHNLEISLVHGDLWQGNIIPSLDKVYLIDPAIYYGDRETDLAMMLLFGGFGENLITLYNKKFPLKKGYRRRIKIYQLYHLMNHANIFGSIYISNCKNMLREILHEDT